MKTLTAEISYIYYFTVHRYYYNYVFMYQQSLLILYDLKILILFQNIIFIQRFSNLFLKFCYFFLLFSCKYSHPKPCFVCIQVSPAATTSTPTTLTVTGSRTPTSPHRVLYQRRSETSGGWCGNRGQPLWS